MISLLKGTYNWTIILAVQDSVKRESGRCNQKALSTVRFTMGGETQILCRSNLLIHFRKFWVEWMSHAYIRCTFYFKLFLPLWYQCQILSLPQSLSTIQRQTMPPLFSEHRHGQEWNNIMMPFEAGQLRLCQHFHYKNLFSRINISVVKIHTQVNFGSRNDFIL